MAAAISGSDEERAARRLIAQAGTILQRPASATCRRAFVAALFAGASPEDLVRYEPRELADLAGRRLAVPRRAQARRAEDPLRHAARGRRRSGGARQVGLDHRDRQRRHAVPGRLGAGRAGRAGLDVRLVVHPIFTVERDARRRADRPSGGEARPSAARSARASSTSMSSASRTRRAAPRSSRRSSAVLADVRVCVQDWRPMLARVGELIAELKNNPPPLPVGRDRRGDPVPRMAGRQQFHLPRRARTTPSPAAKRGSSRCSRAGSASCARRDVHVLQRGNEPLVDHAGDHGVPARSRSR